MLWSTRLLGQALSGERQWAISGNALVHSAIGAGSRWWETGISQWQCLCSLSFRGRLSVVYNREQSVAALWSTRLYGQALSAERQVSVSGNAFVHSAIGAGPQWWETVSSQCQCLSPLGHSGRLSVLRERAVSGNTLVHSAIGAGPQWCEIGSGQWQHPSPLNHHGSPGWCAGEFRCFISSYSYMYHSLQGIAWVQV